MSCFKFVSLFFFAVVLSVIGCAAKPPIGRSLAIYADSEHLRDSLGRVVILRGINYSGLEFGNFVGMPNGPAAEDFAQMASWGVNAVRLAIAWSYLEPQINVFDESYLTKNVDPVVAWAAQNGIVVIPEMHQYHSSACFQGGNGAPTWTCAGKYAPADEYAYACDLLNGTGLASDGRPLRDHFVDAWKLVARHYAKDPRIGGFDFFNEPNCLSESSSFQRDSLHPFLRQLRREVVAEGAEHTLFYCPVALRNAMFPAETEPLGDNVVYAPHLYTQTAGSADIAYRGPREIVVQDYTLAASEAKLMGAPFIAGEFGGSTGPDKGFLDATNTFLRDSMMAQDQFLVGGLVWAYFPGNDIFSVVDEKGTPKGSLVDTISRPYAQHIAGTPTGMTLEDGRYTLRFDAALSGLVSKETLIFVPATWALHGVDVGVSGGDVAVFDANTHLVRVTSDSTAKHEVVVRRR